jgi:hypothetical protein
VEHQRIFHLGRELKSGGRSLLKLGLGRFNNHVLHLHIPPNDHDSKEDETSLSASGTTASGNKRRRQQGTEAIKNNNSDGVIDLLDDSEDDEALIDDSEVKRPRVS